jgi:hypothetical protein
MGKFLEFEIGYQTIITKVLDKKFTEEEWDKYGEAEQDEAFDVLIAYQEIATRSIFDTIADLPAKCRTPSIVSVPNLRLSPAWR